MRISLLIISLFFISASQADDVYRSVDEDGNIIFTDKPLPDAEKITIDEIQTVDTPKTKPFKYTPAKKPTAGTYSNLMISSPANDTAIRDNTGNISISVAVEPSLRANRGDRLIIYMDNQIIGEGSSTTVNLKNVDRGTHSLSAVIVSVNGKELKRSPPSSFTMIRHSSISP